MEDRNGNFIKIYVRFDDFQPGLKGVSKMFSQTNIYGFKLKHLTSILEFGQINTLLQWSTEPNFL